MQLSILFTLTSGWNRHENIVLQNIECDAAHVTLPHFNALVLCAQAKL